MAGAKTWERDSVQEVYGGGVAKGFGDLGDMLGIGSQRRAAEINEIEAQKNREFQEYMATNAHQLEVQDLKAAGLNPVLSAMGGDGATTPSGGQGTAPAGGANSAAALVHAITSLQVAKNNAKMVDNTNKMLEISKLKQQNAARALESKSARETAMKLASFFLK